MALFLWPGTNQEFDALLLAVDEQCHARGRAKDPTGEASDPEFEGRQCAFDDKNKRTYMCPGHEMLTDEKLVRSLIFVRRKYCDKLWAQEMLDAPSRTT